VADNAIESYNVSGPKVIKIEKCSDEDISFPNPKFLMIHATMAMVLHSSGVGEALDFVVDRFNPQSSLVIPGECSGDDLDIRLSLLSLARTLTYQYSRRLILRVVYVFLLS